MMKKRWISLAIALILALSLAAVPARAVGSYGVDLSGASYQTSINPYYRYRGSSDNGSGGECTWYVWGRTYEKLGISLPWFSGESGNAKNWGTSAYQIGYSTGQTPRANSILVSHVSQSGYGHVMFIERISGNTAYLTEGNYYSKYHEDTLNLTTMKAAGRANPFTSYEFIYLDSKSASPTTGTPRIGSGYTERGSAVFRLQTMLNKVNNAGLTADGIFGTKTQTAIKNYQSKKGLTADGICGDQTWAAIEKDYNAAVAPAPADTASSRPRVGYGFTTKGSDVKDMQTMLNAVNNAGLEVDGIFGNASLAALKAYQAKKGLEADGICGPNTWAALEADYKALSAHTHSLTKTFAVAATCTTDGTRDYWTCSGCGKVFSDANGTEETTVAAMTVKATGHSYENGVCTRCGAADPDYTAPVTEPDPPVEPDPTAEPDPGGEPDPAQTIPEVHFPRQNVYHQDQFTDVKANQWFTDNVAEAFAFSLMKGDSATTFNPYGDVTVAEAVTMASRIHSIYTTGGERFVQTGDKWYQVYLDYAYRNGVISRAYYNSDVTQKATRAQFAEIFANSLPGDGLYPINTVGNNAVPDVPMTASYASSVYKLYRAGILTGSDVKGTFSPQSYITRAESAAIVSRMAESNNRVSFTLN